MRIWLIAGYRWKKTHDAKCITQNGYRSGTRFYVGEILVFVKCYMWETLIKASVTQWPAFLLTAGLWLPAAEQ
jgi:hypothetical protein